VNQYEQFSIGLKKENLKRLSTFIRIVVGLGLILFLLWRLDVNKILAEIGTVELRFLLYGLISYFLFVVVSAWRWQVLLDFKNYGIGFGKTLIIYFIATFFNNFLPTTIGGDVMRVYYSMKDRRADALAIVIVDRILGFVGLFIFALFAVLYLLFVKNQTEFLPIMIIGFIVVVFITYIFFSEKVYSKLSPLVRKLRLFGLGDRLNRMHEAATDFGGAWGPIMICIVHSIIIQAFLALGPFFVMRGMGYYEISLLPFFIYVPIINVVSMIPISFNALGVREYFYIVLFSRVNLSDVTCVSISLVAFFLYFLLSMIGGIFFVVYKKDKSLKTKEVT